MSTYTLVDFRLPRPAGAGLAMTLYFTVSYWLIAFLFARNVIVLVYKELTGASPDGERMRAEG